jgi:hypothetical protein
MNPYLLAALLLTTPAVAETFAERWHVMRIYDANEFTPIDAMARPMAKQLALPVVTRSIRKSRAQAPDICRRHGKRKTMIGKYRWRCR